MVNKKTYLHRSSFRTCVNLQDQSNSVVYSMHSVQYTQTYLHIYIHTKTHYIEHNVFVSTTSCIHLMGGVMLTVQHSNCFAQVVLISPCNQTPDWLKQPKQ